MPEDESSSELVDDLRGEQRRRWLGGDRAVTEAILDRNPRLVRHVESALELVYGEVLLRAEHGEAPQWEEYAGRFPALADRLAALFEVHRALESGRLLDPTGADTPVERTAAGNEPGPADPCPLVDGYEILSELGRGGMGVVYEARHLGLNRKVALEMILAGRHAAPAQVARFRAEAEAVARLQHPNIVQIHDVGAEDGRPFFSLELIEGGSLAQYVGGVPQPAARAADWVQTLAQAIDAAHRQGIIHRDLKPSNILLAHDGTLKITDFGLAKSLGTDLGLTGSESVLGSPSYMAPEQAEGRSRQVGPAADIYALGAILYTLIAGRPPFQAESPIETLRQVVEEEPPAPRALNPKIDRDLEAICLQALEKQPTRRYPSAAALAEDLQHWRAGQPIRARRIGRSQHAWKWARRRPAIAALSGLLILVAAGGVIGMFLLYGQAVVARQQATERARAEAEARTVAVAQTNKALEALQSSETSLYSNRIALADRYRQAHDADRADELLDDCPASLRDWEWHYLKRRQFEDVTIYPHRDIGVVSAAFSPDDRYLVALDYGRTIPIRDRATSRVLELPGLPGRHATIALSPDGQWMAVGGDLGDPKTGAIQLWSTTTWSVVKSLAQVGRTPHAVAFSPDGRRLVAGHEDDMVRVWDLTTGAVRPLPGHQKPVMDVAFSPDGRWIAAASRDATVRIWDAQTSALQAILPHDRPVFGLAFHPGGRLLASSTGDLIDRSRGDLTVWDVESARVVRKTSALAATVHKVRFSPNGRRLATAGWDRVVRIWDAATLNELLPLTGHTALVLCLTFSHDGNQLVSGGADGTLRCWNAAPLPDRPRHQPVGTIPGHKQPIYALAMAPDGRSVISAGEDHTARVWDLETERHQLTYRQHKYAISALAVRPDGLAVATGGDDMIIRIWDPRTGADLVQLRGHTGPLSALAFHPDGVRLGSVSQDGTVRLWSTRTGELLHSFIALWPAWFPCLSFTPDGRRLAAGCDDGLIYVWDVATHRLLHRLRGHTQTIVALAFHPDSWHLASASLDGTARIWDSGAEAEVRLFDGVRGRGLAWSPDGQHFAMSGAGGSLKVWEFRSGRRVLTLRGHADDLTAAVFTPDGRRIVTTGWDRTIKSWEAVPDDPDLGAGESHRLLGHAMPVFQAVVLPDGRRAISGGDDGTIRVWDIASGRELRRWIGSDSRILGLAVTPDGRRVLAAGEDPDIRVWEIESSREIHRLKGHRDWVYGIAVSPDGRHALTGGGIHFQEGWKSGPDRDLHLWNLETGTEIRRFSGHRGGVWSVAISPDGRRAASGSMDATVRVWDFDTGREARRLEGHHAWVTNVEFLSDGQQLLSAGSDHHLRLWDMTTGREIRRFDGPHASVDGLAISPDGRLALSSGVYDHQLRLWEIATGREVYHYEVPHLWLTRGRFTRDGRQAIWPGFDGVLRVWDLPERFPGRSQARQVP